MSNAIADRQVLMDIYDALYRDKIPDVRDRLVEYFALNEEEGWEDFESSHAKAQVVYTNWSYHLFAGHTQKINQITAQTDKLLRDLEIAELAFRSSKIIKYVGNAVVYQANKDGISKIISFYQNLMDDTDFAYDGSALMEMYEYDKEVDWVSAHKKHISVLQNMREDVIALWDELETNRDNYEPEEYEARRKKYKEKLLVLDTEFIEAEKSSAYANKIGGFVVDIASSAISLTQQSLSIARLVETGGDVSAEKIAGAAMFMVGTISQTTADVLQFLGKSNVAGAAASGAAGVAFVGASAANFASVVRLLDNPDLSDEHRAFITAELGLQATSMALASVQIGLSIALKVAQFSASTASTVASAIPVIGALASVVGAINPLKWAEFSQKQDRIDALKESDAYSASMLGDLLGGSLAIEAGFYAASTAVGVYTGVGTSVLMASGVGAPVAAIFALVGAGISAIIQAFEQVALEGLAEAYREKMMTDEDGNFQTIDEFMEGSFDQQQDMAKARFESFFDDILAGDTENVFSLGSHQLTSVDLSLLAITRTAGKNHSALIGGADQHEGSYLTASAKHYFEQYRADSGWNNQTIRLVQGEGNDRIHLPDTGDQKNYLTFMTPLFASGTEDRSREALGKDNYVTELKITDLAGWVVVDSGDNSTTFDLDKIVTSAEGKEDDKKTIDFSVMAGGGDDMLFAYEASIKKFDGGDGVDTVSYAKLSGQELASGIHVEAVAEDSIVVRKLIAEGSKYYEESIETHTENYGKRTEHVEYRAVSLSELKEDTLNIDNIVDVEVVQGSSMADYFDVERSTQILAVMGFDGNDEINVGEFIKMVAGGDGHDTIAVSAALLKKLFETKDINDAVLLDGGAGIDSLKITGESYKYIVDKMEQIEALDTMAQEITNSMLPPNTPNYAVEFANTKAALIKILGGSMGLSLNKLQFKEMENVSFDLPTARVDAPNTAQQFFNLDDFQKISSFIGNSVNADGYVTELGVAVSGDDQAGAISVIGSIGSDYITGSKFAYVLSGGIGNDRLNGNDGNDILVGGEGNDVYEIAMTGGHDVIAFENFQDLHGDIVEIAEYENIDFRRYNSDLVVKVSDTSSLTILNYFDSVDTAAIPARLNMFSATADFKEFKNHLSNSIELADSEDFEEYRKSWGKNYDGPPLHFNARDFPITSGDVNGDGYDDLIFFGYEDAMVALGSGDGVTYNIVEGHWDHGYENAWANWDGDLGYYEFPRFIGDTNGDGRDDIVGLGYREAQIVLGQTDGSFGDIIETGNELGLNDAYRYGLSRHMGDFNGDGRMDVLGVQEYGFDAYIGFGTASGEFDQYDITQNLVAVGDLYDYFKEMYPEDGSDLAWDYLDFEEDYADFTSLQVGDVNGDGSDDFVVLVRDGAVVMLSDPNADEALTFGDTGKYYFQQSDEPLLGSGYGVDHHSHHAGMGDTPRHLADVDGDGRDDLVTITKSGVYVSLSQVPTGPDHVNPISPFAAPKLASSYFGFDDERFKEYHWYNDRKYRQECELATHFVQDANNDGRADLAMFTSMGVMLALGQEDGTFAEINTLMPSNSFQPFMDNSEVTSKTVGDFNGDGYQDYATLSRYTVDVLYGTAHGLIAAPEKVASAEVTFKFGTRDIVSMTADEVIQAAYYNDISSDAIGAAYLKSYNSDFGSDAFGVAYQAFRNSGVDWTDMELGVSEGREFDSSLADAIQPLLTHGTATEGNDQITGSQNGDILDGLGGRDTIYGHRGDDLIVASNDVNDLDGGEGQDILSYEKSDGLVRVDLRGGQSSIVRRNKSLHVADNISNFEGVIGSAFNDILHANNEDNILKGGAGKDTIIGEGGDDLIHGGGGKDHLYGGAGYDTLSYVGEVKAVQVNLNGAQTAQYIDDQGRIKELEVINGFEAVIGSDNDDQIFGNELNNELFGGTGNDLLVGGAGDDMLQGGTGHDTLNGQAGDDIIQGGDGDDLMFGENGNDSILGEVGNDTIIGGNGNDTISGGMDNDELHGEYGDDVINGGDGDDLIAGGPGDDILILGGGVDTVHAADGNDYIVAGDGFKHIFGGTGVDTLTLEESNKGVSVNFKTHMLSTFNSEGTTTHAGYVYDVENLNGTVHADLVVGSDVDNIFELGRGDDTVSTGAGNDIIIFDREDYGTKVIHDLSDDDTIVLSNFNGIRDFADLATALKQDEEGVTRLELNNATKLDIHTAALTDLAGSNDLANKFHFTAPGDDGYRFVKSDQEQSMVGTSDFDVFVLTGNDFGHRVIEGFDPEADILQVNGFDDIKDFFEILDRASTTPTGDLLVTFDENNSVVIKGKDGASPLTTQDLDSSNFAFRKLISKEDRFVIAKEEGEQLFGSDKADVFVFSGQEFGEKHILGFDHTQDVIMLHDVAEYTKMSDVYDRYDFGYNLHIRLAVDEENFLTIAGDNDEWVHFDDLTVDNFIFA